MKKYSFLVLAGVLAVLLSLTQATSSQDVSCKTVAPFYWHPMGSLETCSMNHVFINASDVECSTPRNLQVTGLYMCHNKNIEYLPMRIQHNFPNLVGYSAADCNITFITKANFKDLSKLLGLWLLKNKIELIPTGTFDDLTSLEELDLRHNNIKFMNPPLFEKLKALKNVWLYGNECINKSFYDPDQFPTMIQEISLKCTFKENDVEPLVKPGITATTPRSTSRSTPRSTTRSTTRFTSSRPNPDQSCGISTFEENPLDFKILDGDPAGYGEFPFLVALMRIEKGRDGFFCGGTLISSRHVLTAAHCVHPKFESQMSAASLEVVIGGYNLAVNETASIRRSVQKILCHPEWQKESKRFDGDLAIIFLSEPVEFSDVIQPSCLPAKETSTFASGNVVGWGETKEKLKNLEFPAKVNITVIDSHTCFVTHPALALIGALKTFCGGGNGTTGPCNGDSGGGFYVLANGQHTLEGIVSVTLHDSERRCNATIFTLYTSIAEYTTWIEDNINGSK